MKIQRHKKRKRTRENSRREKREKEEGKNGGWELAARVHGDIILANGSYRVNV